MNEPPQIEQSDCRHPEAETVGAAAGSGAAPCRRAPVKKALGIVSRKKLINELNHINFQNRFIFIRFKNKIYSKTLALKAYPQPCQSSRLVCNWAQGVDPTQLNKNYRFTSLHVPTSQHLLNVVATVGSINERQITLLLPEFCEEIGPRKPDRHNCSSVSVNLFQNGALFSGRMLDFNGHEFRVALRCEKPQTFDWLDDTAPVTVILYRGKKPLYSGECRIIRKTFSRSHKELLLQTCRRNVRRFKKRDFRCRREKLRPTASAVFEHPFYPATITLKIGDISGTGFSVYEKPEATVLIPGMIIPELQIIFSDSTSLHCLAQVIYSADDTQADQPVIRSGLAFLDIRVEDHFRLLALLQQAADANSYFCGKIDIQALWKFFFDSSFIYPQKYKFIEANKDIIKATYQKLYNQSSGISSHFIYQEGGRILAHMAMLRFYERSWLIHHHAAVRSNNPLAGLHVLYNVSHFIMAGHRIDSLKMDYVFCYYQPDNKFPARIFGGTAARINNPQICSVDNFAYYHHYSRGESALPDGWLVKEANPGDLRDLGHFYEAGWNGLMLQALQLEAGQTGCAALKQDFRKFGLKRGRHLLSLYCQRRLCAIFMVNQSDLGLNMSDLTNAITAFVVHPGNLTREVFIAAVRRFEQYYRLKEIPVMIYPAGAAEKIGLAVEKTYCLWVYNTQNLDHYFRYLQRYFKFVGNSDRKPPPSGL